MFARRFHAAFHPARPFAEEKIAEHRSKAAIGIAALVVAWMFSREVLAAPAGTAKMQEIAGAIQEGAAAYLNRQFRTLGVFAALVFFMLFLLPAQTTSERIGRSLFFLVGAGFSAAAGYFGMWMAVRGNVVATQFHPEKSGDAGIHLLTNWLETL